MTFSHSYQNIRHQHHSKQYNKFISHETPCSASAHSLVEWTRHSTHNTKCHSHPKILVQDTRTRMLCILCRQNRTPSLSLLYYVFGFPKAWVLHKISKGNRCRQWVRPYTYFQTRSVSVATSSFWHLKHYKGSGLLWFYFFFLSSDGVVWRLCRRDCLEKS